MMQPSRANRECAEKSKVLLKTLNPCMPKEARTKIFVGFVNSLSDQTFFMYRDKILDKMNPSKSSALKCKNTEEQVAGIIGRIPRLELIKDDLMERVKTARKSYGLEV